LAVRIQLCGRRIVNRDRRASAVHPPAEVAVVHCRQRYRGVARIIPGAVSESFVRYEKERSVSSVVHLGNVHRTAERKSEIVLIQYRRTLSEEAARIGRVVAQKIECDAVYLFLCGFGRE